MSAKLGDESSIQGHGTMGVRDDFRRAITKTAYLFGLLIILGPAYAQYLFGGPRPIAGCLVVYGIPILVVGRLWGRAIV
jgi:hypothetical protein